MSDHNHDCYCGTGKGTPHLISTNGCKRFMTESPSISLSASCNITWCHVADDVRRIRELLSEPNATVSGIARSYKVNHTTISDIKNGITWKNIN